MKNWMSTVRVRTGLVAAAALGVAAAAWAHPGHDDTITITDLTRRALTVIEGQVESAQANWNQAGTQILTTVRLRVDSLYKGAVGEEVVEFTLLGGTVGDRTLAVLGQPTFEAGERTIVFLEPGWRTDVTPLVQMEQGKLEILADEEAAIEMVMDARGVAEFKQDVVDEIRRANAAVAP